MHIKNLFGYNWWSRRAILRSMAALPWETVVESCGASFDCMRDIFVHSLQAEQFWIRRLSGKRTDGIFNTPFSTFADIKAVQTYADAIEVETNEYLKTLTDEQLQSVFEFTRWDGTPDRKKVEDILMHVVEEEIHHRGELLCIYWQNDLTPPYTSYTSYVDAAEQP
jgi:uncharacterized damage-inducible protein DinB